MNASAVGFYFLLLIAISTGYDREVKLRFYHASFEKYTELPLNEADKMLHTSWYNPNRTTVIFCHGFTGFPTGPAVTGIITAYLEQEESNVALLNWEYLASSPTPGLATSYVNWAAPNARQLGARLVDTFSLLSDAGLDISKTHLIGHSLGAQIWGIAGFKLRQRGIQLPWITGVDPAAVGFETKAPSHKLSPASALYVDVIHTDPSKYGLRTSSGTVDFWANYRAIGPVRQPGCGNQPSPAFSPEDLCNHNRSWKLLADAIKYPGTIIGSYAKNYKVWKHYSKEERVAETLLLGKYNTNARPGNYYFVTNSESPYGLKTDGL
ncbi:jg7967 [Pararge aegeria aegeria]|uniref:Jg7967 protein n=1 Tax=Pararge aegeria aegeria TaxID=348720 RepID=A0A8S4SIM1_9NEOP|nr:jg7967 [Pararge aegeria aegeria]CAH2265792.1 jg7967 [Pararge aegeria aegeria]CAH2265794.1 jg7967 [Pararge aegeria aegeria]